MASATQWQPLAHSAAGAPLRDAGALARRQEPAHVRLRREGAPGGQERKEPDQDRLMHEIDRQAVPAREGQRARRPRRRAPAVRATSALGITPGARARLRPRKTTPAQGRSGRQSSVFGQRFAEPEPQEPGRVEQRSSGPRMARRSRSRPDRKARPCGLRHERRSDEARGRDAVEDAEEDALAGSEDRRFPRSPAPPRRRRSRAAARMRAG